MKTLNCLCLSVLMLLSVFLLQAQKPEHFHVQLSQGEAFGGNPLRFRIWLASENPEKSRILYVSLLKPDGESVLHYPLKLNNDYAEGAIHIPTELPAGLYTLRIYSTYNLQFNPPVFWQYILPYYPLPQQLPMRPQSRLRPKQTGWGSVQHEVEIEIQPLQIEAAQLSLKLNLSQADGKPIQGDFFISISEGNQDSPPPAFVMPNPENLQLDHFTPPQQALTVWGSLTHPENGQAFSSQYLAFWSVAECESNWIELKNGRFEMQIPDFNGSQYFQIFDFQPFRAAQPIVESMYPGDTLAFSSPKIQSDGVDAELSLWLEQNYKRQQIQHLFQLDGTQEIQVADSISIPFQADKSYLLDNYIRFEEMESFIFEGMPWVYVVEKDEKKGIRLDNFDTKLPFEKAPLMMVDHFISFDETAILNLHWKSLYRIDQFMYMEPLQEQFGLLGRYGCLNFYTKAGIPPKTFQENPQTFVIQGFQEVPKFPRISNFSGESGQDRIPDITPLLYWGKADFSISDQVYHVTLPYERKAQSLIIRLAGRSADGQFLAVEKTVILD